MPATPSPVGDPVTELRAAIVALHRAGIEVWLDVVFNHTMEWSAAAGPTVTLRGLDAAELYRLRRPDRDGGDGALVDDDLTGCHNTVDFRSPIARALARQALVRWAVDYGIDGFRFDLAATLVRGDGGPSPDAPFLAELAAEPALADVKLVAEPWDLGPDGYLPGDLPEPWSEWNGRYRDDVRDLWRGEPGGLSRGGHPHRRVRRRVRHDDPPPVGFGHVRDRPRRLHARRPRVV